MTKDRRGGARPNSGPEKGAKYAPTLAKEAAREAVRVVVMRHMDDLLGAQIAHAKGLSYLVAREKGTGKFTKLTKEQADAVLAGETDQFVMIEVWQKDPSVQAFTDLLNRALDKPREQVQEIEIHGSEALLARLDRARLRSAGKLEEDK